MIQRKEICAVVTVGVLLSVLGSYVLIPEGKRGLQGEQGEKGDSPVIEGKVDGHFEIRHSRENPSAFGRTDGCYIEGFLVNFGTTPVWDVEVVFHSVIDGIYYNETMDSERHTVYETLQWMSSFSIEELDASFLHWNGTYIQDFRWDISWESSPP